MISLDSSNLAPVVSASAAAIDQLAKPPFPCRYVHTPVKEHSKGPMDAVLFTSTALTASLLLLLQEEEEQQQQQQY